MKQFEEFPLYMARIPRHGCVPVWKRFRRVFGIAVLAGLMSPAQAQTCYEVLGAWPAQFNCEAPGPVIVVPPQPSYFEQVERQRRQELDDSVCYGCD